MRLSFTSDCKSHRTLKSIRIAVMAIIIGFCLTALLYMLEKHRWNRRTCTFNTKIARQMITQVETLALEKKEAPSYQQALQWAVQLLSLGSQERPLHLNMRSLPDQTLPAQNSEKSLFHPELGLFQYWKTIHSNYEIKITIQVEPWKFLGLPYLWMNDLALLSLFVLFTCSSYFFFRLE